jgi:hypothetical protein
MMLDVCCLDVLWKGYKKADIAWFDLNTVPHFIWTLWLVWKKGPSKYDIVSVFFEYVS